MRIIFDGLAEAAGTALGAAAGLTLLIALAPFLLHLVGLALLLVLGAPLWFVAAQLFGLH